MPYSIAATAVDLETRLATAGYSASLDPERVNPPGIWLQPRALTDTTLDGGGSLLVWLYLIAPGVEVHDALSILDDLLEGLPALGLAADPNDPDVDLLAAVLLPTNPAAPLPAYRLAVTTELEFMP